MNKYFFLFVVLISSHVAIAQIEFVAFKELEQKVLKNTSDSVIVVNFWATWCAPCVKELPSFKAAQDSLETEKIKYFFVSLDFPGSEERVANLLAKKELKGEVLLLDEPDANQWINKLAPDWQGNIPATWFVYPKENKQYFHIGTIETAQLIDQIHKIK